MSFEELRDRPAPKANGLRTDWSVEENRYEMGLADFVKSIEEGNSVLEDPPYVYDPEKIPKPEVVVKPEVPKPPENKPKIVQDEPAHAVECNIVRGADVASSTIQPPRPAQQESVLNTKSIDPFDDDDETTPSKPQDNSNSGDDFFDSLSNPLQLEQPKKSAAPQAPADVKKTAAKVIDPFEEQVAELPKTPAKPDPAPSSAPVSAPAVQATGSTEKVQAVKPVVSAASKPHGVSKHAAEAMEGFDFERFEQVMETVNRITDGLPRVELARIMNSVGEYAVSLELDHHREDPNVLSDRLCEIQGKRDSLHALTLYLTPLVYSMKQAADYLESAGINCSIASSKEKRISQIKLQEPDFYVRYSDVLRTSETVDKTFMQLDGQYECISRCITLLQIKAKLGEVSRGEVPFDPPYRTIPTPAATPAPQGTVASGKPPQKTADDDFLNRQFSQPVSNSSKKFENLESFKSGMKGDKKTTNQSFVGGTQESEW